MPRVAPRRGRAVAKDWLGRRRCSSKSHAGVVKLAQVTPRPLGLERLSSKIRPKARESYKVEEPADDLGVAGLHEGLVGDGAHAGMASRLCGNQPVSGGGRLDNDAAVLNFDSGTLFSPRRGAS